MCGYLNRKRDNRKLARRVHLFKKADSASTLVCLSGDSESRIYELHSAHEPWYITVHEQNFGLRPCLFTARVQVRVDGGSVSSGAPAEYGHHSAHSSAVKGRDWKLLATT